MPLGRARPAEAAPAVVFSPACPEARDGVGPVGECENGECDRACTGVRPAGCRMLADRDMGVRSFP